MTETWAGLLTRAAREYDRLSGERTFMLSGGGPEAAQAKRLRRLASLLEQITPEMVTGIEWATVGTTDTRLMTTRTLMMEANAAADLLRALSTAPTEETGP